MKVTENKAFDSQLKELSRPLTVDDLIELLGTTVKRDDENKAITFLSMLLTYTEEDQINIGFLAQSSSGKSYIPLELSWYFPKEDVMEYGYSSPTSFFHDWGVVVPDPTDRRDVEEDKKRKIIHIDLCQKILIFLDQPHDQLLQRLRPLLSHDRKNITLKITDKREKSGLRTKTVVLEGYPTVLFCAARFNMQDQEKTRLLLLSPEISQEKLRETIQWRIHKESDRKGFKEWFESDPNRIFLRDRVDMIRSAEIKYVNIPEHLREGIYQKFLEDHRYLIPRHQRDISRLLGIIKAHGILNFMHRERVGEDTINVNEDDIAAGFRLYYAISEANELGLSPELFNVYRLMKPYVPKEGITVKDFQAAYYKEFHKPAGYDTTRTILRTFCSVGLFIEEPDAQDKRLKRYYIAEYPTPEHNILSQSLRQYFVPEGGVPSPQQPQPSNSSTIQLADIKIIGWVEGGFDFHPCCICGYTKLTSWQIETFKSERLWICEDCKSEWEKRRESV
jgi:hypothetical protein